VREKKIAYKYDKETGKYIGTRKRQFHGGKYSIPGNCTLVPPPILPQHKIARINGKRDGWDAVDDYRGMIYYDKQTRGPLVITEIGIAPGNEVTELEPQSDFDRWDEKKGKWILDSQAEAEHEARMKEDQIRKTIHDEYPINEQILILADAILTGDTQKLAEMRERIRKIMGE